MNITGQLSGIGHFNTAFMEKSYEVSEMICFYIIVTPIVYYMEISRTRDENQDKWKLLFNGELKEPII